jgi:hypothetical protein
MTGLKAVPQKKDKNTDIKSLIKKLYFYNTGLAPGPLYFIFASRPHYPITTGCITKQGCGSVIKLLHTSVLFIIQTEEQDTPKVR